MKRVYNLLKILYYYVLTPNTLAKKKGVIYGNNCIFNTKNFGTEPYLIKIGNDFYSSSNVQFITHDGSVNVIRNLYKNYQDVDYIKSINIGNNVFIGYGAIILAGTTVGNNVIIGAGSLVKGNLKSDSVYAGVPVKFICSLTKYIDKNKNSFYHTKNYTENEKRRYFSQLKNNGLL